MESKQSLGFVETKGLTAAIEAADAMVKAARVKVRTVANADAGLLSVICEGDLAACKAAVDAGKAAADRVGEYITSNIIARPDPDTEHFVSDQIDTILEKKVPSTVERPVNRGAKGKGKK
jgi:microcompartment protein CcmL/EutN